jgi:hypothetical protein
MKNKSEFSSLNGGKETETMSAYFLNGITMKELLADTNPSISTNEQVSETPPRYILGSLPKSLGGGYRGRF